MMIRLSWLLFVPILIATVSYCRADQLTTRQKELAQVTKNIKRTEASLSKAKNKRIHLQKKLAQQEKRINLLIQQRSQLSKRLADNNQQIIDLGEQIKALGDEIQSDQAALAKQVRSRYAVDIHQPLKWLLSPGSKNQLSQILTYYRYMIQTQQNSITAIQTKTKALNERKKALSTRIKQDEAIHQQISQQKASLEKAQKNQQYLVAQLEKTILSSAQKLKEFRENQQGLGKVIAQITKQNQIAQRKPFASRRHHLPRPVSVQASAIKPIHQGLAFFAREGTPVKAVHPGKILFSDWLKGYGLLLIIDHGHGFMTLYAHNMALSKQKGDWVQGGEIIAEVGHSGGLRENGLYFEIRHDGKAISPINWLS